MSILIVDDNIEICNLVQEILVLEGYKVRICSNPTIVFEMISQQKPKLIITDMLMSGLDGRELVKEIKSQKKNQGIKVMLMSAHPESATISKTMEVDGYISKPFELAEFSEKVKALIN